MMLSMLPCYQVKTMLPPVKNLVKLCHQAPSLCGVICQFGNHPIFQKAGNMATMLK